MGALWIPSGQQVYHRTGTGTYLVPSNAAVGLRYFYWHVSGTALFFEGTTTPPANLSYVTGASGSGAKVISSPTVLGTTADQYRYVGAVLVAAGGTVYRFSVHGDGDILEIAYLTDTTVSPFRIITDGTATTNTLVDCSPVVPLNSREVRLMVRNRSDKTCLLVFRDFGEVMMRVPAGLEAPVWVTINANRVFEYRLASAPNAGGVTFDVLGYRDRR